MCSTDRYPNHSKAAYPSEGEHSRIGRGVMVADRYPLLIPPDFIHSIVVTCTRYAHFVPDGTIELHGALSLGRHTVNPILSIFISGYFAATLTMQFGRKPASFQFGSIHHGLSSGLPFPFHLSPRINQLSEQMYTLLNGELLWRESWVLQIYSITGYFFEGSKWKDRK